MIWMYSASLHSLYMFMMNIYRLILKTQTWSMFCISLITQMKMMMKKLIFPMRKRTSTRMFLRLRGKCVVVWYCFFLWFLKCNKIVYTLKSCYCVTFNDNLIDYSLNTNVETSEDFWFSLCVLIILLILLIVVINLLL